jgi:hypothetical protein
LFSPRFLLSSKSFFQAKSLYCIKSTVPLPHGIPRSITLSDLARRQLCTHSILTTTWAYHFVHFCCVAYHRLRRSSVAPTLRRLVWATWPAWPSTRCTSAIKLHRTTTFVSEKWCTRSTLLSSPKNMAGIVSYKRRGTHEAVNGQHCSPRSMSLEYPQTAYVYIIHLRAAMAAPHFGNTSRAQIIVLGCTSAPPKLGRLITWRDWRTVVRASWIHSAFHPYRVIAGSGNTPRELGKPPRSPPRGLRSPAKGPT